MLKKIWDLKLARFASVGIFNTIFDTSMLNILVFVFHVPLLVGNLISASISMSTSYFLNHRLVFRSKESHTLKKFLHFFAVTGVGILGIQSLVIYLVTHILKHQHALVASIVNFLPFRHLTIDIFDLNVAKICAVLVAMTWNFAIYHFVIFKRSSEQPDEDVLV